MSDSEVDTSRTVVRTYVPAYQRDEWDEHADELDMSRSEFVRTMVQAGRRTFDPDESATTPAESETDATDTEPDESGADVRSRVVSVLDEDDYYTWEELLDAVTADIEENLEAALDELQTENRVRYSGRNGGYTLQR